MNNKIISIITDRGAEYGIGHYVRCNEIKCALQNFGYRVIINVLSDTENNEINIGNSSICLIDLPYDMSSFIDQQMKNGIKIVTLEHYSNAAIPDLNISVMDFPKGMYNYKVLKSGLKYIIIRREIKEAKTLNTVNRDYGLIMMGGSNVDQFITEKIGKSYASNNNIKIIVGPYSKIKNINNNKIQILKNPKNLPCIMSQCNWCVTNGGITMLEMIYLNKYILVYPQNRNEEKLAKIMLDNQLIHGINQNIFINSRIEFNNMSKVVNKIFKGNGAIEIAKDIIKLN